MQLEEILKINFSDEGPTTNTEKISLTLKDLSEGL